MKHSKTPAPEWNVPVDADKIGDKPVHIEQGADTQTLEDLVRRLKIVGLKDLTGTATLQRENGNRIIYVYGHVSATVIQTCVVTLEPVETRVEEDFEAWYADPAQALSFERARRDHEHGKAGAEMPMLEEYDDPEPIVDGTIPVGEVWTQFLSLGINPYPHKEGIEIPEEVTADAPAGTENESGPFAALKQWQKKREENGE